MTCQQSDCTWH